MARRSRARPRRRKRNAALSCAKAPAFVVGPLHRNAKQRAEGPEAAPGSFAQLEAGFKLRFRAPPWDRCQIATGYWLPRNTRIRRAVREAIAPLIPQHAIEFLSSLLRSISASSAAI